MKFPRKGHGGCNPESEKAGERQEKSGSRQKSSIYQVERHLLLMNLRKITHAHTEVCLFADSCVCVLRSTKPRWRTCRNVHWGAVPHPGSSPWAKFPWCQ